MPRRSRHPPGFYAALFNDVCDGASKYRPKAKSIVMGPYKVERIVAKRFRERTAEYFIQWKNFSPAPDQPSAFLARTTSSLMVFR